MKCLFIFWFSFCLFSGLSAQEESSKKALNKARPKYFEIGLQNGYSYHRDLATSPNFYRGYTSGINLHYHRFDALRERRFGFTYYSGNYRFSVLNESARSRFSTFQLDFEELYQIKRFAKRKYQLKAGGKLIGNFNLRVNPALQNASVGYEIVYNLMGSVQLSRDVSRTEAKSAKFLWLIPYNWKPRKRLISYQLNLGLINANVRNGYAYVNQRGVTNEFPLFADYRHNFFSGFRMNAVLRYTVYLKNENALRFSYLWDAYTTGGKVDQFEMANHLIGAALLFDLSNW